MNDDSDFFGDVFDDPDEDPLLGEERSASAESAPQSAGQGPPSWVSEEQENGRAAEPDEDTPCRKEIHVDQEDGPGEGLHQLNEALGTGWKLVRISLAQPDGEQAATREKAQRFVATLEQERPQSLFDFGASS